MLGRSPSGVYFFPRAATTLFGSDVCKSRTTPSRPSSVESDYHLLTTDVVVVVIVDGVVSSHVGGRRVTTIMQCTPRCLTLSANTAGGEVNDVCH